MIGILTRLTPPMDNIQLDAFHVMEFSVERDAFHVEQAAHHIDGLAHGGQLLAALDAHVACQRIPPRADAADDAIGRQIVQRQEGRREQTDVARPVVDHARADLDPLCDRRVGRHRDDRIADQTRFRLPDRFEAACLRRSAHSPIHLSDHGNPADIVLLFP